MTKTCYYTWSKIPKTNKKGEPIRPWKIQAGQEKAFQQQFGNAVFKNVMKRRDGEEQ